MISRELSDRLLVITGRVVAADPRSAVAVAAAAAAAMTAAASMTAAAAAAAAVQGVLWIY